MNSEQNTSVHFLIRDELLGTIHAISNETTSADVQPTEIRTSQLCRCLLGSVFSLIETTYLLLENGRTLEFNIIKRSLLEYVVTHCFIAAMNNQRFNLLFSNYATLKRYWYAKKLGPRPPSGSEVASWALDYHRYVRANVSYLLDGGVRDNKGNIVDPKANEDYWIVVDRRIRDKYRLSWSGLNTKSMVDRIPESTGMKPLLLSFVSAFGVYSNYTHPTTYGVAWITDLSEYRVQQHIDSDQLFEEEKLLLMAVFLGLHYYELAQTSDGIRSDVFQRFSKLVVLTRNLRRVFENIESRI